jgi:hypothetical protein
MTMAQIMQNFRTQEEQAARKMSENNLQQGPGSSHKKKKSKTTTSRKKEKGTTKFKILPKDKRARISDNAPYPIHPGMGHTWGNCRANAFNEERQSKCPKTGDKTSNSMIVHLYNIGLHDEVMTQCVAINDSPCETDTYMLECYVTNEATTIADHYMNNISFTAEQEQSRGNETFVATCDETYSIGDNKITLKTYTDTVRSLRLRSIAIMAVGDSYNVVQIAI